MNFANNDRSPLLLIAGGKDHTVPAAVTRANFDLFDKSQAVSSFKEYPERTHWTIGQDGWEEVADFALEWANRHAVVVERTWSGELRRS